MLDYQDLVKQIVDAEQEAQTIAEDAEKQRADREARLTAESVSIRDAAMDRARARVEEARKDVDASVRADLGRWEQRLNTVMNKVNTAERENRSEWVNTLFSMIVEGQS